ncbi:MAG: flagellar basal-body rod modification protein FlgD [Pseudonocardiales bacterium]|jgi:flagellar basal-body rod modification protein FlgD|nr:flagellar basal-body rod modification protein FlgD [Pseudonocardiales bacterium]MDQ1749169.1 flagellar basal-body rod modification protein FlgD [Pseudonocardiales bacterium]
MTNPVAPTTVAATASPVAAPTTGTSSTDNTQLSSKAFLQLLVAQLQYQDPSKPVDTSEFMNETATLTQVQTMEANAKATADMLSTQQAQTASSMVGRTVTYLDTTGKIATGTVSAATISTSPPSLRIGSSDVGLSQIQQVLATTP